MAEAEIAANLQADHVRYPSIVVRITADFSVLPLILDYCRIIGERLRGERWRGLEGDASTRCHLLGHMHCYSNFEAFAWSSLHTLLFQVCEDSHCSCSAIWRASAGIITERHRTLRKRIKLFRVYSARTRLSIPHGLHASSSKANGLERS